MDYLINFYTTQELKDLIKLNESILNMSYSYVEERWQILLKVGLSFEDICEIISSNPFYLDVDVHKAHALINSLYSLKDDVLSIIKDNPWILNKEAYEIKEFILISRVEGLAYDDIILKIKSGDF